MRRYWILFLLPSLFWLPSVFAEEVAEPEKATEPEKTVEAKSEKVTIGADARFRFEIKDNRDFSSATDDGQEFVGTRVRLNAGFKPIAELEGFIQPQFTGTWGQIESNVNGAGTVTGGALTSGALKDRDLTLHQGWVHWKVCKDASLKLGRQEMIYGDHLIIGNVGWSNVGRSFDAGLLRFRVGGHEFDAFFSFLAESNANSPGLSGEDSLAGLYAKMTPSWHFTVWDLYVLYLRNGRTGPPKAFNFATIGTRLKGKHGNWDGRFEGAFQVGERLGATMRAWMIDIEKGYTFDVEQGLRMAFEYNRASGDDPSTGTFTRFHSMFPTSHKWFGYMDFFGRQNIQSGVVHMALKWDERWKGSVDVHSFWRVEGSDLMYGLAAEAPVAGQAAPAASGSKHAGEEVDLVLTYAPNSHVELQAGGGVLIPGPYIENAFGGDDLSYFSWLQATFKL